MLTENRMPNTLVIRKVLSSFVLPRDRACSPILCEVLRLLANPADRSLHSYELCPVGFLLEVFALLLNQFLFIRANTWPTPAELLPARACARSRSSLTERYVLK